jgi:hypothetical protein
MSWLFSLVLSSPFHIHPSGLRLRLEAASRHCSPRLRSLRLPTNACSEAASPCIWKDIRYTVNDDYLYIFVLDWPCHRRDVLFGIPAPTNYRIGKIESVETLSHQGSIEWEQAPDGLTVRVPKKPCDFAHALKILPWWPGSWHRLDMPQRGRPTSCPPESTGVELAPGRTNLHC